MTTRRYAPEYRRQMVELVRTGRTAEELSREFECSAQAIRNWVRQSDLDEGRRSDGLTTAERDEPSLLRWLENSAPELPANGLQSQGPAAAPRHRETPRLTTWIHVDRLLVQDREQRASRMALGAESGCSDCTEVGQLTGGIQSGRPRSPV